MRRKGQNRASVGAALIGIALALIAAAGLLAVAGGDPVAAQQRPGASPGAAAGNPGEVPGNADLWRAVRRGEQGYVSGPDKQAGVLIQSEGNNWRAFRNGPLSVFGGWAMFGVIALLAAYFAWRGRIRIEHGASGRLIERFNTVERFGHWLTAISFIVLALTGLNVLYGRYVLKPVIGAEAFSWLSLMGKYVHNYIAFAFIVGLVLIVVLWIRHNIPNRLDLEWLAKGGGLFSKHAHPPARKFNAGQKIVFWAVALGGIALSVSGLVLLFPFEMKIFGLVANITPMQEMQLQQIVHAFVALVLIGLVIAHIYLGTIGMEGSFDSMSSGMVDENWAREHHSLWAAEAKKVATGGDD